VYLIIRDIDTVEREKFTRFNPEKKKKAILKQILVEEFLA